MRTTRLMSRPAVQVEARPSAEKMAMTPKRRMAVTSMDSKIAELADKTDHRTLAIWAADCAERVLPFFEKTRPHDGRPRDALKALRVWIRNGVFKMAAVRGAALAAHAAARSVERNDAARSAARAAGQAMATAHARRHSIAAAIYAATAIRDSSDPAKAEAATLREREWQYRHLLQLRRLAE